MRLLLLSLCLCGLAGCLDPLAFLPGRLGAMVPPQTAVVELPTDPATCYAKAYRELAAMPARIVASDPQLYEISALVKEAVFFHVAIAGAPTTCTVTVQANVLPNKLVTGEFTEVHDYVTRLRL